MALVFRRRQNESFVLRHPAFGEATITVCALENKRVKLGINAPLSVSVVRSELLTEQSEQGESQQGTCPDIWLKADREQAKDQARTLGRSYIDDLEAVAKLADQLWPTVTRQPMTPEQHWLANQLFEALAKLNFLAEMDSLDEEEEARELEVAHA